MTKRAAPDSSDIDDLASPRNVRADARRNVGSVVMAARAVFDETGLDAPVRDIATKAGVGIGTLYRHFPKRGDLIAAVFQDEIDALAEEANKLAKSKTPIEALAEWMHRCAGFITTKRGFANALRSGDPTVDALPIYFKSRLAPALKDLLDRAAAAGQARADIDANDLLGAVACLAVGASGDKGQIDRTLALLTDGVCFGAKPA